ncbi:cathelicidin-2-like [Emydura macquarii macquarii]|uniref:cathelicidin-2-like n=1 Tax=Emydura macquarii macquarii TaxID=1129001 RepID=UPI00352B163F
MASGWAVLLLLATLASALPVPPPQTYDQAIAQAIDFYNQGPTVKNIFRLLIAAPQPDTVKGSTPSTVQQLNFTIMETTCLPSGQVNVEQCDFKDNGLVRDCIGHFSMQPGCPVVAITCDVAPSLPTRVTRWWIPALRIGAKIAGHAISFFNRRN